MVSVVATVRVAILWTLLTEGDTLASGGKLQFR